MIVSISLIPIDESELVFFGETNPYLSGFEDDFDYSRTQIVGEFFYCAHYHNSVTSPY